MNFCYGVQPPTGASVSVDMTITPQMREIIFARLRPLIEPGRGTRLTVSPTRIVVEGLTAGEADSVREALDQLNREFNPKTTPKRASRESRARRSTAAIGT
jgi:hypothetical protein